MDARCFYMLAPSWNSLYFHPSFVISIDRGYENQRINASFHGVASVLDWPLSLIDICCLFVKLILIFAAPIL